jgi:hypothetical protein
VLYSFPVDFKIQNKLKNLELTYLRERERERERDVKSVKINKTITRYENK